MDLLHQWILVLFIDAVLVKVNSFVCVCAYVRVYLSDKTRVSRLIIIPTEWCNWTTSVQFISCSRCTRVSPFPDVCSSKNTVFYVICQKCEDFVLTVNARNHLLFVFSFTFPFEVINKTITFRQFMYLHGHLSLVASLRHSTVRGL